MERKTAEHLFFFALLGIAVYLVAQIISPFITPLALAAIIATVSYPLYLRVIRFVPGRQRGVAALLTLVIMGATIFVPLFFLSYILFLQAREFYETASGIGGFGIEQSLVGIESLLGRFVPGFSIDIAAYAQMGARWITDHIGDIFAHTASTIFSTLITAIALFYMLKDGRWFFERLIKLSPLPDTQDLQITQRLSQAIRSVVLGTLAVALIQGVLTSIGFFIFGVPQPVLWGSVAAIGALIPGVGTSFVFIGAIIFAVLGHAYVTAIGLAIWGLFAVGLIDNLLGPYLMGRGIALHPLLVLLSVLGGLSFFGPVGFLIGPVALSFFTVLLELYAFHVKQGKEHAR